MTKSSRLTITIATVSLTFSAVVAHPANAGDDTELAKKLWAKARELAVESAAINAKLGDAANRGDWSALCSYARQDQNIANEQYDLAQKMTGLDLDPQNAATVQEALSKSKMSIEAGIELLNLPECNPQADPIDDEKNEEDIDVLNVAVANARKMDAEGSTLFDDKRWSVACSYLTATQSSYANNSRLASELSQRFDTQNNPQPQLAQLSAELAGLEKAVTIKRDIACENEKLGG